MNLSKSRENVLIYSGATSCIRLLTSDVIFSVAVRNKMSSIESLIFKSVNLSVNSPRGEDS